MKSTFKIIAAFIFILAGFNSQVVGQLGYPNMSEIPIFPTKYMVISTTGLSIRSKPTIQSKRLAAVPFGQEVEVISDENFGIDSLGVYPNIWGGGEANEHPIKGQWVKVRWKKITGFMFNKYLFQKTDYFNKKEGLNEDFAFLYVGIDCRYNIVFHPRMHWYGVYHINGKYLLKKTTISFFNSFLEMSSHGITAKDNENILFLLGSKLELREKELTGFYAPRYYYENEMSIEQQKEEGIERVIKNSEWGTVDLYLNKDGKRQLLNPEGVGFKYQIRITWVGDLDQDGKKDYIILYGEKSAETVLYLSSQAEEGQIVKPVAAYFSGYCC